MLGRKVDLVSDTVEGEQHCPPCGGTDLPTVEVVNVDGDCSLHLRFLARDVVSPRQEALYARVWMGGAFRERYVLQGCA